MAHILGCFLLETFISFSHYIGFRLWVIWFYVETCFEKVILKTEDNLHDKYEKPEQALKDEYDMQHQRQVAHYFHFFRG